MSRFTFVRHDTFSDNAKEIIGDIHGTQSIRPAEIMDLRAAAGVCPLTIDAWEYRLESTRSVITARLCSNLLVGACLVYGRGSHIQMTDLVVHRDVRGHGVGTQIVKEAIDIVRQQKRAFITIHEVPEVDWQKRWFHKLGFVGRGDVMYYDPNMAKTANVATTNLNNE